MSQGKDHYEAINMMTNTMPSVGGLLHFVHQRRPFLLYLLQ